MIIDIKIVYLKKKLVINIRDEIYYERRSLEKLRRLNIESRNNEIWT